ncbi:uncharacterized protein LOC105702006 [Orussus abietinus]|uniref:uncharacterized protein LOC105702006 n=1 Tax=Orussus abietinus TaxID=222816 RepID=UPI000626DA8D|nr:uncharacterized protein LOC105702006 [Orussus abietinus]XP_023287657.1 uncharacterized protein LOC105702006 [Orussus abietinus]XP_023287658.1 uncharacterized protein LOC105702006 [Orussus abietinus]
MRQRVSRILAVLLLAGAILARPQKTALPGILQDATKNATEGPPTQRNGDQSETVHNNTRVGDGPEKHRELKDFQYMDQSLRTVATQLLNVTNPDEVPLPADKIPGKGDLKVMTVSKMTALTPSSEATTSKNEKSDLIKDVNSEISAMESMGVGFGRPINSKFGYFEIGHPGEAMALTEEELEKELHSARLTTTKGQPTTTGGISTWILLNPPTSTLKPVQEKTKVKAEEKKKTSTKPPSTTNEKVVTKLKSEAKVTATTTMVKSTLQELPSTEKVSQSQGNDKFGTTKRPTTTRKPEKTSTTGQNVEKMAQSSSTATLKSATTPRPEKIEASTVQKTVTKKATTSPPRTTVKTKVTSSSSSTSSRPASTTSPRPVTPKVARPNFNRPKGPSRRTTPRPDTNKPSDGPATSTSKIEKVTFRPVQIVPANRKDVATSVSERPAFVTKIKASVLTENTKTTTSLPQVSEIPTVLKTNESKSTSPSTDLVEVPVRAKPGNKSNNVLKVQLKKPVDEPPSIEIEPIKVNAPILKIEKVEKLDKLEKETKKVAKGEGDDEDILDNSRIDLKFDFNPEVTMIEVQTSSEATSTASTTTKRPKNGSNKRKKNKVRRRRPSTTVGTTTLVPLVTLESNEVSVENSNSLQESKIEPETKVANATKNKKKPVQKPISTQIYNFLSREVMPSFGMMSLVGLGLGLASYFLYPFGGTIARRNYDVEPNYKYNLDEYGGNFGQNEEEVFSKVLQGMTNHDAKFGGIKDYESNYYRYQHYDGAYSEPQTTRKSDLKHSTSSGPMYRPLENTYDLNYRNTEFKYPDVITTPGSYYERPKQEFSVGNANPVNRQFVVGNVPKELELFEVAPTMGKDGRTGYQSGKEQVSGYAEEVAQAYAPVKEPDLPQGYDQPEAQALKSQDGYEEIEITPSAVAVEHGPRTLEDIDSMHPRSSRRRREVGIKNEEDLKKVEEHRPRVFKVSSWVHSRSPSRRKRDSVIQVIPSRSEVEKDEQEEDLSNEILDIIDSVIPGEGDVQTPKSAEKKPEEEDQKRRHKDKKTSQEKQPESTSASSGSTEEATTFTAGPTTRREEETSSGSSSEIAETSSLASSEVSESTTDPLHTTEDWFDATTEKNHEEGNSGLFGFVKRVAEVKFRLGLTILKHASEGFARYLGHVQKRLNGEE